MIVKFHLCCSSKKKNLRHFICNGVWCSSTILRNSSSLNYKAMLTLSGFWEPSSGFWEPSISPPSLSLSLSLSLSRSVRILFHISHTQVLPQKQIVVWSLPHWRPCPLPTIGIRAWMFFIPLPVAIRIFGSQHSVFLFCILKKQRREKKKKNEVCISSR